MENLGRRPKKIALLDGRAANQEKDSGVASAAIGSFLGMWSDGSSPTTCQGPGVILSFASLATEDAMKTLRKSLDAAKS